MIKIGNIILNDYLRLRGLETAPAIQIGQFISFDGTVELLTMPAPSKRTLSLEALRNGRRVEGYYTLAQLEGLRSIAAAGMATALVHDRGTFNVMIIGGFESMAPVIDYRDPLAAARYVGTIQLIEV